MHRSFRLLLISEDFTTSLLNLQPTSPRFCRNEESWGRKKRLSFQNRTGNELPSVEKQVICRTLEYWAPYDSPDIPTREKYLTYITDKAVCEKCANKSDDPKSGGVDIRPIKNSWFTVCRDGDHFFSLGCKRRFISIYVAISEERWSERIGITNLEEWKEKIEPHLSSTFIDR